MSRAHACGRVSRVPYTILFGFWLTLLHSVIILVVLSKLTPNHNDSTNKTCIEFVAPVPEMKKEEPELVAPEPETRNEEPAMAITETGAWGGDDGQPWNFLPSDGGITRIIVHSNERIVDSLSFVGRNRTGGLEYSGDFGLRCGSTRHEVTLEWPEEYLTAISGTIDEVLYTDQVVRSLGFRTNHGRKHGPFGHPRGNKFNISMNGSAIVGFHGRADLYVDAIGIYITPVSCIVK